MRVPLFIIMSILLLPSVCSAADIHGQDGDVRYGEGEIAFRLDNAPSDLAKSAYNTISMGYTGGKGEYNQYLSSAGYTYPEPLHNVVNLRIGYLRFVRHINFRKNLEFNWGAGLGFSNYRLTGTAAGQRAYFEDHAAGVHGQVGLGYHLNRMIAFEGNLSGYVFNSDNSSYLFGPQIQFSFTPVEAIRLYVGYRNWNHYIDLKDQNLTVDSTLTGLVGGLRLTF